MKNHHFSFIFRFNMFFIISYKFQLFYIKYEFLYDINLHFYLIYKFIFLYKIKFSKLIFLMFFIEFLIIDV